MRNQRLGELTIYVPLDREQKLADLGDTYLLVSYTEGVRDPLQLGDRVHQVLVAPAGTTLRRGLRRSDIFFSVSSLLFSGVDLSLNLLEPTHHVLMLSLHVRKLALQLLVFINLLQVALIDFRKIADHLLVLILHLGQLLLPLLRFLI